ncbi:MAG TPA: cephalosporin hydroxylase family protein [Nitrosopumilaceae archaeon]|nr:cephalosporin hydroxylase family protein [Nitrosopumilaceae archaeon]
MNPKDDFDKEKKTNIISLGNDVDLKATALKFMMDASSYKYTYNFTWLGRPIIQYPQDILALQEIIWELQPDLIIETGIAHGGSLIFSSSILELIGKGGQVLGIDIDIREHNRVEIERHPMSKRITMIEGSSVDSQIVKRVHEFAKDKKRILVILDSNHTHEHVLNELQSYSSLVTKGSYIIVFDTAVEDVPEDFSWNGRPWGKGNNPKTAVWEFLKTHDEFEIDTSIHNKLLITVAPDGYLKKIK